MRFFGACVLSCVLSLLALSQTEAHGFGRGGFGYGGYANFRFPFTGYGVGYGFPSYGYGLGYGYAYPSYGYAYPAPAAYLAAPAPCPAPALVAPPLPTPTPAPASAVALLPANSIYNACGYGYAGGYGVVPLYSLAGTVYFHDGYGYSRYGGEVFPSRAAVRLGAFGRTGLPLPANIIRGVAAALDPARHGVPPARPPGTARGHPGKGK